jgi:uncharacterized protein (TIGR03000 family)
MKRRLALLALPTVALACLLMVPEPSFAQRGWGRVGWGGGWGGGWGRGWGWGPGISIGFGSPYYGGWGYGGNYYGSSPIYTSSGYYTEPYVYSSPGYVYSSPSYGSSSPGYVYSSPSYGSSSLGYVMPGTVTGSTGAVGTAGYQSFYPGGTSGAQPGQGQPADNTRTYIRVRVPADAQVFFDGQPTSQTGTERMFVSPPLATGPNYSYEISARWMQNGQEMKQSRTVRLTPGQTVNVDFQGPQQPGNPQQPLQQNPQQPFQQNPQQPGVQTPPLQQNPQPAQPQNPQQPGQPGQVPPGQPQPPANPGQPR